MAFALLNMALFVTNCVLITVRFRLRPGSFTASFTDQVESLFINAFVSPASPTRPVGLFQTRRIAMVMFAGDRANRDRSSRKTTTPKMAWRH